MQDTTAHRAAAQTLARSWAEGVRIGDLPPEWRPANRREGYAIQAEWPAATGQRVAGWKIAATSKAGQQHIAVSGPVAGPVFAHRVHPDGAVVSLAGNGMRVAECEIVFRIGRELGPRTQRYSRDEVLAAVTSVHPGIEVPDSRFQRFDLAGEAQLIADCACTNQMVVGAAAPADQRVRALPSLVVRAQVSDSRRPEGVGSNVLGDPVEALVWLVNEITIAGQTIDAGQFVTTGACVAPIPVQPGLCLQADFGWIGRIDVSFA